MVGRENVNNTTAGSNKFYSIGLLSNYSNFDSSMSFSSLNRSLL